MEADPNSLSSAERAARARLIFVTHDISRMRREMFDQHIAGLGLTAAQWWALTILSRGGQDGMTQAALARELESSRTAVGNLLDRLEAGEYVVRWEDPRDGRAKLASVTDKARHVLDRAAPIIERLNDAMFVGLGIAELNSAVRELSRIRGNIRLALDRPQVAGLETPGKRGLPDTA